MCVCVIIGSSADWVSVPKNMALIITREKGGFINIMRAGLVTYTPGPPMEPQLPVVGSRMGRNGSGGVPFLDPFTSVMTQAVSGMNGHWTGMTHTHTHTIICRSRAIAVGAACVTMRAGE